MTQHEGLPVHGYRPQSTGAVDAVNRNKQIEEEVLRLLDAIGTNVNYDPRWLAIARTHIELGFMAFNRAIFKPERISLARDEAPDDNDTPF